MIAVVVLYRCLPDDSTTINSLKRHAPQFAGRLKILVYDNSPESWNGVFEEGWSYLHDSSNGGIAAAYNAALHLAAPSTDWLLLLDQDSSLPNDFLPELFTAIDDCEREPQVAAVVPRVYSHGALISPSQVKLGHCVREYGFGIRPHEITAINSGSAIRVSVLTQMEGFNIAFWLDFLDYWLYHQIHALGYCVFVSRGKLEHSLSVQNYNGAVSDQRYRNILHSEMLFTNTYRPKIERIYYAIRLFARCGKQTLRYKRKNIALDTLIAALRQLRLIVTGVLP